QASPSGAVQRAAVFLRMNMDMWNDEFQS
ncbi:hypothetical protein KIPB_009628, partial [Kipferlia bialata]